MFARSENYFMETTVSFGILTICSDWSLCTMFLPQYALRLLICLPNGAGGEILCWAVGSWRAGTMSYSSCILHSTNSSKGVNKYWMKESWYTWPHCLIPGITYQHPIISILLPCFIFLLSNYYQLSHYVIAFIYYFSFPDQNLSSQRVDWTGLISWISLVSRMILGT